MAWLADAHAQWHQVHGKYAVCPLDCGVGEVDHYDDEDYGTADDVTSLAVPAPKDDDNLPEEDGDARGFIPDGDVQPPF